MERMKSLMLSTATQQQVRQQSMKDDKGRSKKVRLATCSC